MERNLLIAVANSIKIVLQRGGHTDIMRALDNRITDVFEEMASRAEKKPRG